MEHFSHYFNLKFLTEENFTTNEWCWENHSQLQYYYDILKILNLKQNLLYFILFYYCMNESNATGPVLTN